MALCRNDVKTIDKSPMCPYTSEYRKRLGAAVCGTRRLDARLGGGGGFGAFFLSERRSLVYQHLAGENW